VHQVGPEVLADAAQVDLSEKGGERGGRGANIKRLTLFRCEQVLLQLLHRRRCCSTTERGRCCAQAAGCNPRTASAKWHFSSPARAPSSTARTSMLPAGGWPPQQQRQRKGQSRAELSGLCCRRDCQCSEELERAALAS
jgi:hypothetical protein